MDLRELLIIEISEFATAYGGARSIKKRIDFINECTDRILALIADSVSVTPGGPSDDDWSDCFDEMGLIDGSPNGNLPDDCRMAFEIGWNAGREKLSVNAGPEMPETLSDIREAGWSVAVHNDYRQGGEMHTFWLFTHPCGRWVKGEGRTDAEALNTIRTALDAEQEAGR